MIKKAVLLLALIAAVQSTLFCQKKDSLYLSADSLDIMIGQMILIGIGDDNTLQKDNPVFEAISTGKVGSIILFEKNISFESPKKKLREIINHAQKSAQIPLLVSIDEEGGKVNRLKTRYGFPKTVTAQYLGTLDNIDSTRYYATNTASALHEMGINMNFAPSLDLNINPKNPAIGKMGRSYGVSSKLVAKHAGEVVKVHDEYKVGTTLKHFPGHGSSKSDTHLGIADVTNTWQVQELYPYKALLDSGLVRAIMTAHIVNGVLDSNKSPATLSEPIVSGLLRGFLNYDGVIFSDDMQMQAIASEFGLEEAIKKTILAGVDILLFANNVPQYQFVSADEIFSIIQNMVINEDIQVKRIVESYNRIMALKNDLGLLSDDYKDKLNSRLKKNK